MQDARVAAYTAWTSGGIPERPRQWLISGATRRLIDSLRADASQARRELAVSQEIRLFARAADDQPVGDDSSALLFPCHHPALAVSAQLALTLRAVGGLSTAGTARERVVR